MSDGQRFLPPRRKVSGERDVADTQRTYQPTTLDLSRQIESLSAQVTQVHAQGTLTRTELGTLSKFVMGDLACRVTGVEAKHGIPAGVKMVGKYAAVGTIVTLVQQLWPVVADLLANP